MVIVETEKKDVEVTSDIICDSCGETCKTDTGYEYMELKASWGYSTKKDMERWSAHICEKCVDEKLSFVKFFKEEIMFLTHLGTQSEYEKKLNKHILAQKTK